jgi:hypothetical protein
MIIGICGFIGSGKDTVAKEFVKLGCVQDSFAAPLKDMTATIFGWNRDLLEGDTVESRDFRETPDMFWTKKLGVPNFTPRLALQLLGTDIMREHFSEDIWLDSLEYRLRCKNSDAECVVVSDARFRNELQLINDMGGKVIWVQRGELPEWFSVAKEAYHNAVNRKIMETRYADVHESEWNWAGYPADYIIKNDGSIEDLHRKILSIHSKLFTSVLKLV